MYLAFQAVHDPFDDTENYKSGIPPDYFTTTRYEQIMNSTVGRKRRQYAMALALMDSAVEDIHLAIANADQENYTYIIFA